MDCSIPQPDFGAAFHRRDTDPVAYAVRNDENKFHDLFYISSYLHESLFRVSDITGSGKRVVIPVCRIRWELLKHLGYIENISSRLIVTGVRDFKMVSRWPFPQRRKLEIRDIHLLDDELHIKTTFDFIELIVAVSANSRIRMEDSIGKGRSDGVK